MRDKRMAELTNRLLACGYHSGQIRGIINDALANGPNDLGSQERLTIYILKKYVETASKAKIAGQ